VYKRTAIFILLLLIPVVLAAQKAKPKNDSNYDDRLLHFGFSMGMNTMDFMIKMKPGSQYLAEVTSLKPGINIQIVTDYRPSTYLDLRFLPGVSFGQRNLDFYDNDRSKIGTVQIPSSFLEFPLLLKAKGMRLNNSRPYLIGGLSLRYDLAGKTSIGDEVAIPIINKADFNYEVGAGVDFYLPYFKLTIEAKMSNGLRDVLNHNASYPLPFTEAFNGIESLRSQMWTLSFHFE
jgi:hypothetical protein